MLAAMADIKANYVGMGAMDVFGVAEVALDEADMHYVRSQAELLGEACEPLALAG